MQNNYFSFLDYRAAQRKLSARFSHPRGLLLHTLAFVVTMTLIWAYGIAWRFWIVQADFLGLPVILGVVWSLVLAVHSMIHYWRSPARTEVRELAVEAEMRSLIEKHGDQLDHEQLFALHRRLEADLERQSRWSVGLVAFALVNAVSWWVSALNVGTSWPFQMTLPFAIAIIGGVYAFLTWQRGRSEGHEGWFTRLPVRHIAAYGAGVVLLGLAGGYRMINHWDVNNTILVWGVALILHIVLNVVIVPVVKRFLPGQSAEQPEKRKPPARLVLADDGEVLDIDAADSEALYNSAASR